MKQSVNILLICAAGMSTSLLVSKMQAIAKSKDVACRIHCSDIESSVIEVYDCDVVLLAPQVSYFKKDLDKMVVALHIPAGVIDVAAYRDFDGNKILECAINLFQNYHAEHSFEIIIVSSFNSGVISDLLMLDIKEKMPGNWIIKNVEFSLFQPQKCRANVVLIEPQNAYMKPQIIKYLNPLTTACGIIRREDIGRFDGVAVMKYALSLYEEMLEKRKENYIKKE